MKLAKRLLAGGAVALAAGAIGTGTAGASVSGCTDSWVNASGGQWDTASNWSTGQVPSATDSVCIAAAGTYTVVLGNETISTAALTVGGPGAGPTLQIGNGGSGEPNITVSGTVTVNSGATISDGWGGSFTAGSLVNAGTFEAPASSYNSTYTFGSVQNSGTFASTEANAVSIANGGAFVNAGGTISATGGTLSFASPTAGSGTLALNSGGMVSMDGSSAVTVADRTALDGGSICGGALTIGAGDGGAGGTLAFATTPGTGPACGPGAVSDQVFVANVQATLSGTIPAAYTVTAGDGGHSFNFTALSGNVVNQGTFVPGYGATVTGAGKNKLTNKGGTLLVPASGYVTALNTALANTGTVTIDGATTASLSTGQNWSNGTTGKNGTIAVAPGTSLALGSPSGKKATFTQNGTIADAGTFNVADPIKISGGSICQSALNLGSGDGGTGGTLTFAAKPKAGVACGSGVASDQLFIYNVNATLTSGVPAGYTVTIGDGGHSFANVSTSAAITNAGTLAPQYGATLTVNGALTNTGTLSVAASGYTTELVAPTVTNSGTIALPGALALTGSLSNTGVLSLGPVASSVSGTYTQGAAGSFVDPISSSGYGTLSVGGSASLGGAVSLGSASEPPAGTQAQIIGDAGTTGTFSTVTGPYSLSYGATGVTATAG